MTELGATPPLPSQPIRVAEPVPSALPRDVQPYDRVAREGLLRRLLAAADIAAVALAASLAELTREWVGTAVLLGSLPLWVLGAKLAGFYDRDRRIMRALTVDELPALLLWAMTGSIAYTMAWSSLSGETATVADVPRFGLALFVLVAMTRWLARRAWRRATPPERVLLLGSGARSRAAVRKLELFPDIHAVAVGIVPDDELLHGDLGATIRRHATGGCDRVLLASSLARPHLVHELLDHCRGGGLKFGLVPEHGALGTADRIDHVAELPIVQYNTWDVSRSTMLVKRLMDLALAVPLLVALSPVLAIIALIVKLDGPGPVLFRQERAGRAGRTFRMMKFRTMVADAEARLDELIDFDALEQPAFKFRADPRVTRAGRWLRRFSLDELPQLLNVIGGSMSLVGPRPEQVELVERYRPEDRFRLDVKPGITGPMQVYGRGELSFDERLAVERDYIEGLSLRRDVRILLLTAGAVLGRRGAF